MNNFIEYVGYAASAFVLLSFLMKRMIVLRLINVVGCSFFIWYGALIDSWPIIITNLAIALVNGFYIFRLSRKN